MRVVEFPDGSKREYQHGSMLWPIFPKKVIIEPVYGCDKKCGFCSLASMGDTIKYMDIDFFRTRILDQLRGEELNVINFSGIGEPTLHPDYLTMIAETKRMFPTASIKTYTNGYRFRERKDLSYLDEMMEAGLNLILIDCYDKETEELVEKHRHQYGIVNCYDENVFNNSKRTVIAYNPIEQAVFKEVTSIRRPDTQGGLLPFKSWKAFGIDSSIFPVMKRCNKASKSIHIMFDGHVNMCCADNSRSFWMGDLSFQTPREIWQSEDFDMVRYAMFMGWRDIIPTCYTCDRRSFRVGLYPHWGKKYTREQIFDMARRRFAPIPEFIKNMRALDEERKVTNPIIKETFYD